MRKYFSTGQFSNVIKNVHSRCHYHGLAVPNSLEFEGVVKIHGTNSSIVNQLNNETLITQSRNDIITPERDNAQFSAFVHNNHLLFQEIFAVIKKKFPEAVNDRTAVIYGEWFGQGIQSKVAVSSLPKTYAIFKIKLIDNLPISQTNSQGEVIDFYNENWLSREDIEDILKSVGIEKLHKALVFNIYDFPTWKITIDMENPKEVQNTLVEITNAVEKECPVGKYFGISGIGEGVVWTCVSKIPNLDTTDLVFKVKGEKHSVTKVKSIAEVDVEKLNSIKEFIEAVLTENRLEQGLEYLKEQHLPIQKENLSVFLKWIGGDCLKEESERMEASGFSRQDIMPGIANKAKNWFFAKTQAKNESKQPKIS